MLDQARDVLVPQLDTEWSIDAGRPAVALQIHRDDLPTDGERWKVGAEHLESAKPAVQQDERVTGSADLVVELDASQFRVLADAVCRAAPFALGSALCRRLHVHLGGHTGIS